MENVILLADKLGKPKALEAFNHQARQFVHAAENNREIAPAFWSVYKLKWMFYPLRRTDTLPPGNGAA